MDTLHTLFYFIVAIGLLVSIHEFGHFWVARKSGVKVLKFSIGFGKVIWSYQKSPDHTEYVISAIPLGGYVKMVDEREGPVDEKDLPLAFNRQSLAARTAIVAAGPLFNLLLAVLLFWLVFMIGETGVRPLVGEITPDTLVAEAGFVEGDEILSVNNEPAPTWMEAVNHIFSAAMQGEKEIKVHVKTQDDLEATRHIQLNESDVESPEILYKRLGLKLWSPDLEPVIGKILPEGAAEKAGLKVGDRIISADGVEMIQWMQWVDYVQARSEQVIQLKVDRDGIYLDLMVVPDKHLNEDGEVIGRIGAGVDVPEALVDFVRIEYSLPIFPAFVAAVEKTWFYSSTTVQMMGKMLIGQASSKNIGGPISIAQFAGQSAEMGLVHFLKYLALVSVSLGVLNLLPVPVLDGGHLMFFLVEAFKGSPVSEKVQIAFQQVGILMLMSLMVFAVFLDIERLFQ